MAETQANGFDRFNDTLRGLDDQLQDLRDRIDDGRKRVENEFKKRADDARADFRKSVLYRRSEQALKDVEDAAERTRSQLFEALGLATKTDIDKLQRKLNTLSKKLNELTKERAEA